MTGPRLEDWLDLAVQAAPLQVKGCLANCEVTWEDEACAVILIQPKSKIATNMLKQKKVRDWIVGSVAAFWDGEASLKWEGFFGEGLTYTKILADQEAKRWAEVMEIDLVRKAVEMGGKIVSVRKI